MKKLSFCLLPIVLLLFAGTGVAADQEAEPGKALTGYHTGSSALAGKVGPRVGDPAGGETESAPSSGYGDLPLFSDALLKQAAGMKPEEMIKVIIHLKYQPQDVISRQVSQRYAAEMDEIRQQIRAINSGYSNSRNLDAVKDADNYLDPALAVSEEDKGALREISEAHEALSLVIRDKIAEQLRQEVDADQQSVRTALKKLGGSVEFGMIATNTLVATVPVSALQKVTAIQKVARISENSKNSAQLTNADDATRVNAASGLWTNGETGGIYDPAVLDSGTDLTHPGLKDATGRSNFYSWYLVSATTDPYYDDVTTEEDLQGHGSHVLGIVGSYGGTYPSNLGMAYGIDKAVTLKAGYRDSWGDGWMFATDAMWLVDRALYNTTQLRPTGTFGDDVDGINLSFGGSTASDETDYSRFYDSIVSSYPDLLMTIAAGNSGPNNSLFSNPACAYNPTTVANVEDVNTPGRDDDFIRSSSTRGPTANGRRKPDLAAPGTDIDSCNNDWETELDYIEKSGTSMAAPMVQGVAMDLMDAGVLDELQIKALLINTAQKNEAAINFESDADGWSPAYGFGYMNSWAAYFHRTDVISDTVTPYPTTGHYHLYKGQMRDEGTGGEGRDRATMVWNRHATYNPHDFPSTYYALTNLNLYLFEEADQILIDYDVSTIDNVAQVRIGSGAAATDVIINTLAWDSTFAHGGPTEEFALSTEEGFVEVSIPETFQAYASWPSEMEPNEERDFTFWIVNNSTIASHNNTFNVQLPAGWALVSGGDPYSAGTMAGGGGTSPSPTWRLRAQPTPADGVLVGVDHSHYSYYVLWGDYRWNLPANVRWDTTPPSPAPNWSSAPYPISTSQIVMSCTSSSDLHEPVTYYFDYYTSPTGGGGGTDSGWIPSTSYTDAGLSANHRYGYRVSAQDNATTPNGTGSTAPYYIYTMANVLGTPSVTNPTDSTLDVSLIANGNPTYTECAIWAERVGSGTHFYLNASGGSNGGTPFYQSIASWGTTVTANGLLSDTQYGFAVMARNGDGLLTSWSIMGYGTTTLTPTDTVSASITCIPGSGTVPFTTQMTITLENLYTGQIRRVAGRIDVTVAGGGYYSSWRAGYTNIAAGDSYVTAWNNTIPALGTVIGSNQFLLIAQDVTPSPYNQPPYPPAGDTDSDVCVVVGIAP